MVYSYTPTYYSTFHDTITSLCKSIIPFSSFKSRRLTADQKLAKRHSDNLKWQQDSFHRILNLVGLQREGIARDTEVAAFRTHLLDTLIVAPKDQEPAGVIRDKLLFLQELLYAKCISAEDYHSSKRPLLQRLAVQGVEIDCRDVIIGAPTANSDEEWTNIDLKDKEETSVAGDKNKNKHRTPPPIKAFFTKVNATTKGEGNKDIANQNRMQKGTILMHESSPLVVLLPAKLEKEKRRKPFGTLFRKEQEDGNENKNPNLESEEKGGAAKSSKKPWGLDGFKKWKKNSNDGESTVPYMPSGERSSDVFTCELVVASPLGEGPDTKRLKKKIHSDGSSSDFFIDKVLGDNIKKELSRIQSELSATNPNLNFSDEQIEAISTKLPTDKSDLGGFFPKAWCDRYGEIVLDVVKKEFKEHVGEMENLRNAAAKEKQNGGVVEENWVAFEDNEENFHPNLFSQSRPLLNRKKMVNDNNPFYDC